MPFLLSHNTASCGMPPLTLSCVRKIHPLGFGQQLSIHLHYCVETAVGVSADGLWSNLQFRAFRTVLSIIVLFAYLVKTHPDFCGVKPLGLRMGSVCNHFGRLHCFFVTCINGTQHTELSSYFQFYLFIYFISSFFPLNNAALNIFRSKPPVLNFRNKQSPTELL